MNELIAALTSTHYAGDCKNICGRRNFSSVLTQKCSNMLICDIFTIIHNE